MPGLRRLRSLALRTPAKVNLALELLGKRGDGYHEIQTVLQAVDLFDELRLERAGADVIRLRVKESALPATPENLAWRAAEALRDDAGLNDGVSIELRKRIPVAAGLGGGSSDAAAVLWGLCRLWRLQRDEAALRAVAARMGMDVPFFLRGGTALATGRGEEIVPLGKTPRLTLVLVNPNFPLSTKAVYEMVPADLRGDGSRVKALLSALETGDDEEIGRRLYNDLERVVEPRYPEIGEIKRALISAGALGAVLSGSGPTVFGVARSEAHARQIQRALDGRPWAHWTVHTIESGPTVARRLRRAGSQ